MRASPGPGFGCIGVNISVIALWLGHESIETTHIYVEADLETKQRALSKLEPLGSTARRFKPKDRVLAFLSTLSGLGLCAAGDRYPLLF